jgi:hypothetical protein
LPQGYIAKKVPLPAMLDPEGEPLGQSGNLCVLSLCKQLAACQHMRVVVDNTIYGLSYATRYYTSKLRNRREAAFFSSFGRFVRGDVIVKMSELRRKGVPRSDLKIIASDPDLAAIARDLEALNARLIGDSATA